MKLNITKGGKTLAPKIYLYGREGIGKTQERGNVSPSEPNNTEDSTDGQKE